MRLRSRANLAGVEPDARVPGRAAGPAPPWRSSGRWCRWRVWRACGCGRVR